jgi:hypothetical protein
MLRSTILSHLRGLKRIQCVMKVRGPEVSFFFTRFKQSAKILQVLQMHFAILQNAYVVLGCVI